MASKRRPEDKEELASQRGVKSGGRKIIASSGRNICESPGARGAQSIQVCKISSRPGSEQCIRGTGRGRRRVCGKKQGPITQGLRNHTWESGLCSKSNLLEARRSSWPRVHNGLICDEKHCITIHPEPSLTRLSSC